MASPIEFYNGTNYDSKEAEQLQSIIINKKNPILIDMDDEQTIFDQKHITEDKEKGVVFTLNNDGSWISLTPQFIKIHPWKRYKFSMELKKTSDSSPYLRIVCYDKYQKEIESYDLLRSGYPAIINNISSDGTKIICDRTISKNWKGFDSNFKCQAYQRCLGFYFDGDLDKLRADANIRYKTWSSTDPRDGAYCDIQGRIIYLSKPLDKDIRDKIIKNETLIENHFGGSTHIYIFYHLMSNNPNDKWFNISNCVQGTDINYGEMDNQGTDYKFRKGTKFIKLLFTSSKGVVSFKTCKIEQVDIE